MLVHDSGAHGMDCLDHAEAIKSGKASLENLLTEWRDRFEEDDEKATKEVLNFVLQVRRICLCWSVQDEVFLHFCNCCQACGGTGQCVPDAVPLVELDMSELAEHVVEDLENVNGEYPLTSRGGG